MGKMTMRQRVIGWMKKDNIETTEENITTIFSDTMTYYDPYKRNFYQAYLRAILEHKIKQHSEDL